MAKVIHFTTDLFDISKEDENTINPIHGQSLLLWLNDKIHNSYDLTPLIVKIGDGTRI